ARLPVAPRPALESPAHLSGAVPGRDVGSAPEQSRRLGRRQPARYKAAMSAQEPTVGVVGLRYGRAHIPAFQANGCKVVAICQRDQAGAKAVADRYGVPRVFDSWERMID